MCFNRKIDFWTSPWWCIKVALKAPLNADDVQTAVWLQLLYTKAYKKYYFSSGCKGKMPSVPPFLPLIMLCFSTIKQPLHCFGQGASCCISFVNDLSVSRLVVKHFMLIMRRFCDLWWTTKRADREVQGNIERELAREAVSETKSRGFLCCSF